jgi:hypothetical protein
LGAKIGAMALATLAIGMAACGGDDGDDTTAPEAANEKARSGARDLDPFLMRNGEEPGFRQGAAPGAEPRSRQTVTGVKAYVKDMGLGPADERRLRDEGFISFTSGPIRGPRSAGVTNVALFATAKGARQNLAREFSPDAIRTTAPAGAKIRRFTVQGVPGARGFTVADQQIGNVFWVQGRCVLGLGNQGTGPLAGPLSTGARAIYERTNGECP